MGHLSLQMLPMALHSVTEKLHVHKQCRSGEGSSLLACNLHSIYLQCHLDRRMCDKSRWRVTGDLHVESMVKLLIPNKGKYFYCVVVELHVH